MDRRRDHDVVCIEANKILDFCVQEHQVERSFSVQGIPAGTDVEVVCRIDTQNITCREVSDRKPADDHGKKKLVCLAIELPVTLKLINRANGTVLRRLNRQVLVPKQVALFVPRGAHVQCEVTADCCCVFDAQNAEVRCVFDLCIAVKSKATVEVLVPVLGDCPPKECRVFDDFCRPVHGRFRHDDWD